MTQSDAVVLNQFYSSLLISWYRNKDERGIGYFGDNYKGVVASEAYLLNSAPGRAWWAGVRDLAGPEVAEIVDSSLLSMKPGELRGSIERIWKSGSKPTDP